MAGSVLNSAFGFQMNISAKLKVSASKSATSPSCKTFSASIKKENPSYHLNSEKIITQLNIFRLPLLVNIN